MAKIYTLLIMIFLGISVAAMENNNDYRKFVDEAYEKAVIDPERRAILLSGDVAAFEADREDLKKKTKLKVVPIVGKDVLSHWAKKGGYDLWAYGFKTGYTRWWRKNNLTSVTSEARRVNLNKDILFFSAKYGDFYLATKTINKIKRLKKYDSNICNKYNQTIYEVAIENGYTLFADYLFRGGFSSDSEEEQDREKKLILNQILEINKNHLLGKISDDDKVNFLTCHLVMNLPELAQHPAYKDTVLASLIEKLPVRVQKISNKEQVTEISFDPSLWEMVNREVLLKKRKDFENTPVESLIDTGLLNKVAQSISDKRFLRELKYFWKYKLLIDQGLDLGTRFHFENGSWTFAELAADMQQTALALAFENKICWEIFDKEKLFTNVQETAVILNAAPFLDPVKFRN